MRDYQTKENVGGAADTITATKYGAGEFNSLAVENEGAVSRSGQTLAAADGTSEDTTQLAQSLFLHGSKSSSFVATGTANAITLTPVSGVSGVLLPADYTNLDGAQIVFLPTAENTGAVTISIGQTVGTQLGTKKLLDAEGNVLTGAELLITQHLIAIYDAAADSAAGAWILVETGGAGGAGPSVGTNSIIRTNETNIREDIFLAQKLTESVTVSTGGNTLGAGTDDAFEDDNIVAVQATVLPTGIVDTISYYVVNITATTMQLSLTQGGSNIGISSTGTDVDVYETANGSTIGPVTIESGNTVEVPNGSTWSIL